MVLQFLTGIAYSIVQSSWRAATLIIPVYFLVRAASIYRYKDFDSYEEVFLNDSGVLIGVLTVTGLLSVALGITIPRFRLVGDLIAVLFLGFLFWKF